ncbi:related to Ca2+/H+-exchanging protein, vacuolar [Fusarium fujikuroi]|uniref:Sodium/calcium exchanger membrane region domain-containing protein n=1 Tax=Fusarium fujikuroi TaxID=5127 RepID=A0A2H3SKT7_FUSFU|nr:related to Ca2+/H+-exchanging protein, vacuolar [Fusarium fujikuroi]SCO04391.1 related to Ca2+/H+-exchanging protein, vacuolar [Fusarium fujikuroi]SCO07259.1 related to Ca2+/H+-exchanging protein, vacuolar [Fusarium fujikuroi]SCO19262.1 related to Ca2+/H+-exchanging protein, vacuolar [Fusarium fujikuroi]SCO44612.1 related to Ca2+/H+-exchanging protein, vacuolar [Fusarium fujikuroi]
MSPSLATETTRYNDCSPSSASEDEDDAPDPLNHHGIDFSIRDTMKRALRASSRLGDGVRYQQLGISNSNDLETQSPPLDRTQFDFSSHHEGVSFFGQIRSTVVASRLNWLLVFVPIGLAAHSFQINPLAIFMTNAIAIVPLSVMLTEATERIAADAGDTIGALLNITLGNLVELIIFVALVNNHIRIVQASILGSVLVNLLLILGSALFASSMSNIDPHSSMEESELLAALLFVSVFVILIPTAFDYTFHMKGKKSEAALSMSRASSLVVLVIYIVYFAYEMRPKHVEAPAIPLQPLHTEHHQHRRNQGSTSHSARLIRFADQEVPTRARSTTLDTMSVAEAEEERGKREASRANLSHRSRGNSRSHSRSGSRTEFHGSEMRDLSVGSAQSRTTIMERPEVPGHPSHPSSTSGTVAAVTVLFVSSALMSMNAEFLVKTIDDVTHEGGLSEALIGLIILPVVGNIAEYVTVVTVAMRNKLELAISVAVGSAIQIALCVAPLTVLIAWMLGRDLEMAFNVFETTTLVGSGLLINLLILSRAGTAIRAIGLKGALMFACYVIIALGAYYEPHGKTK